MAAGGVPAEFREEESHRGEDEEEEEVQGPRGSREEEGEESGDVEGRWKLRGLPAC